ncbi:DMT family transporter [Thiomonas sp. FB-Cd]|uniref:DMT family transporter n=1 Tax=Thiomonas sp. FB-Cd TaxID=1158292 RepID=UPI00068AFE1A|nr:DMT family transporter [Thiomonas sp. FB-Cd]
MATSPPRAARLPVPTGWEALSLGLLGVGLFAFSLPMTRLAVGSAQQPQLSPEFVALGRAAVAGVLAAMAGGVVFGFPLLTAMALRQVDAVHASLILALLPLFTAAMGAVLARQRPSLGFWACAVLGSALVMAYTLLHGAPGVPLHVHVADALLVGAMLAAALGYALGAHLTQSRPAGQVISWALVLSLPFTLPAAYWLRPVVAVQASAWGGFAYVAVVSMWLGFLAWYRALAVGGTVRISQLQLLQPFLSMLAAAALLHEPLDVITLLFASGVLGVVFLARRMPVHAARNPTPKRS